MKITPTRESYELTGKLDTATPQARGNDNSLAAWVGQRNADSKGGGPFFRAVSAIPPAR